MADAASYNLDQPMVSNPASPGSSPEPFEDDDEDTTNPAQSAQWNRPSSPSTSQPQPQRSAVPLQKRRRVTRACDECRRKKIKCDGKQPCTHCTVYSYDCTYDQPSNRRRNPAPQYIENLEIRLQRAEGLIRTYLPAIDLNDPSKDAAAYQSQSAPGGNIKYPGQNAPGLAAKPMSDEECELRSMIESTGQLDLDEDGQWDFHGGSSGTVFINRMRQQFSGLLGADKGNLFLPKQPRPYPPAGSITVFESPKSASESPLESGVPTVVDLPSKEVARALIEDSLERACSLMRFVHKPSFMEMVDRIYEIPPESYGNEENRFLPLLYVVLALGCMFYTNPNDDPKEPVHNTYRAGIDQGLKYFRAARSMMDITDCRDLVSLQAVLFMILFLQSTANLSTCYSYIGIALRSSLRMGLHRNLAFNFSPIERETRRRIFWVVRKMDTYVSALLGFPHMLSSEDIDQDFPLEVDDEYITKDGILPMPPGEISYYAAANAHSRLMVILAKVIKHIYPVKGLEQSLQGSSSTCYVISHAKIKDIEGDLVEWFDQLPMALRPDAESNENIARAQQLLRLAYAHVQMMLYRPFLHYVSKSDTSKMADKRSYACAAACVSVSRNIVHITSEMKKRGLLVGAYWFTMYTTFFAIVSLVYYVLENPKDPGSQQILADASAGKDALKSFAQRSQAADRCSAALIGLFEKLPERLKIDASAPVGLRKKRAAPTINSPAPIKSAPVPRHQQEPAMGISRATTFPLQHSAQTIATTQPSRSSLDGPRFPMPTASNPNLRQSFNEYISPNVSTVGTPDSGRSSQHLQPQQYPQGQHFGISNALPDLNAMMFPSEDPFAYPNQAMMEFDNFKREPMDMLSGSPSAGQMYMQSSNSQAFYDDLEGQLFGPLPPYLAQGQPYFGMQGGNMAGMNNNMLNSMGTPQVTFHSGMTPNMDGIFNGEGENWSNTVPNQRPK